MYFVLFFLLNSFHNATHSEQGEGSHMSIFEEPFLPIQMAIAAPCLAVAVPMVYLIRLLKRRPNNPGGANNYSHLTRLTMEYPVSSIGSGDCDKRSLLTPPELSYKRFRRRDLRAFGYLLYFNVYFLLITCAVASQVGSPPNSEHWKEMHQEVPYYEDNNRSWEIAIKEKVFSGYDVSSRPVRNDTRTTAVTLGISLYHILDTDEKYQTIQTVFFLRMRWIDEYLRWNVSEFGGLEKIYVKAQSIWLPDLSISNKFVLFYQKNIQEEELKKNGALFSADLESNQFPLGNAVLNHTGEVLFMTQAVAKTYCVLNVRYFPFDRQRCPIKFVSNTYNGLEMDLTMEATDNYSYYNQDNQEWSLKNITAERHEITYACCPEPYPDVTFTLNLKRRSLFYIFNLIFPCTLIYIISFSVFFLPCESNEKTTLEITVLLSTMVFLMVINDTLPPTPDAIPLLGLLFSSIALIVSIALIMAVAVTNVYYRKEGTRRVPKWLRKIAIERWIHNEQKKAFCDPSRFSCTTFRLQVPTADDVRYNNLSYDPSTNQQSETTSVLLQPTGSGEHATMSSNHIVPLIQLRPPQATSSVWRQSSTSLRRKRPHEPGRLFAKKTSIESSALCPSCGGHYPNESSPGGRNLQVPELSDEQTLLGASGAVSEQLFKHEWRLLAQKLDAFFFWVLTIFGTSMLFAIFVSVPS